MALLMGHRPKPLLFNENTERGTHMTLYQITDVIIRGEQKEKYDEWKNHECEHVRETLAECGYFPEHFIKDESPRVQIKVLHKNKEYLLHFLKDPQMQRAAINFLVDKENATVEELKLGLKIAQENFMPKREPHILTKLKATQMTPSPLELNMSLPQLYRSGSLAWARPFSISQISLLSNIPKLATDKELENILNPEMGTREIKLATRDIINRIANER